MVVFLSLGPIQDGPCPNHRASEQQSSCRTGTVTYVFAGADIPFGAKEANQLFL